MTAIQEQSAGAVSLRLDSMSYFTLPVRNLDRAEAFYTKVLGAKVVGRFEPEKADPQKGIFPRLDLRWGTLDLSLVRQGFGEGTIIQAHPHHAFTVKGSQVEPWQDHFKE